MNQRRLYLKQSIYSLFSLTWEELCRYSVPYLSSWKENLHFNQASRYWHKSEPEWDIVAESIDHRHLFLGEAKWTSKIPSIPWIYKTIEELKNKGLPLIAKQSNKHIFYGLFVPEKPKLLTLPPNIQVIDAEEVLNAINSLF